MNDKSSNKPVVLVVDDEKNTREGLGRALRRDYDVVLAESAAAALKALDILRDPAREVSSHYVVDRDGDVYRLVAEDKRAWHAGVGSWRGEDDVNSVSIGVEIVNAGPPDPFPERQMRAVLALCRDLAARHPGVEFVGHSDVAPDRKVDPGPLFPWSRLAEAGLPNPHVFVRP